MTLPSPLFFLLAGFAALALSALVSPLLARRPRTAGRTNFAFTAAAAAAFFLAAAGAISGRGPGEAEVLRLGPWSLPLLLDGLAGLFLGLVALLSLAGAFYSIRYLERFPGAGARVYYFCFPLFIAGMAGLLVADDLSFGFTAAWQLMALSSYGLVRFDRAAKGTGRAALKYLLFMEGAWLVVAGGAFFIGGYAFGDPNHVVLEKMAHTGAAPLAAFLALQCAGFGLKAGVFPLGQLWAPDAYAAAPSPVAALLSGALEKTGVFGLLRAFFFLAPAAAGGTMKPWGTALLAAGALTLFIGTIQAVKQSDADRLLAYSSIGQVGYIVFALGTALRLAAGGPGASGALAAVAVLGALFHVLNHGVFKSLLFLVSGSVRYATGTRDLNRLGGLMSLMPATAFAAGIASLAISGVPATSGFASKWAIVTPALLAGRGAVLLVLLGVVALFTSAVTLACYVKFFGMTFTAAGAEWNVHGEVREVPGSLLAPKILLAAVCLVQGLFPALFLKLIAAALRASPGFALGSGAPPDQVLDATAAGVRLVAVPGGLVRAAAMPLLLGGLLALGFLAAGRLRKAGRGGETGAPAWLGGYQGLGPATRYVDSSMFAAFRKFFRWTGGAPKRGDAGRERGEGR